MDRKLQHSFSKMVSENIIQLKAIARNYSDFDYREDLLQEILYQLWKSYGNYKGESKLNTWVYRVALNTAISYVRSKYNRPKIVITDDSESNEPLHLGDLAASVNVLEDFIGGLDDVDKAIMLLYLDDIPQQEISDICGLSVNLIGVRINRMKNRFKQRHVDD